MFTCSGNAPTPMLAGRVQQIGAGRYRICQRKPTSRAFRRGVRRALRRPPEQYGLASICWARTTRLDAAEPAGGHRPLGVDPGQHSGQLDAPAPSSCAQRLSVDGHGCGPAAISGWASPYLINQRTAPYTDLVKFASGRIASPFAPGRRCVACRPGPYGRGDARRTPPLRSRSSDAGAIRRAIIVQRTLGARSCPDPEQRPREHPLTMFFLESLCPDPDLPSRTSSQAGRPRP